MAAPDLPRLLCDLLEPDSAVIRRATARLREAFSDPQTPPRLGQLLTAEPRPQIRQLAAVLLRRLLLGRWRRLDPDFRQKLPQLLVDALEQETEHVVTVALAQLGGLLLRRGGVPAWAPLGAWVEAGARDPRPPRQEAAFLVLEAGLAAAPSVLAPRAPALAQLCRESLGDDAPAGARFYALRGMGALAAILGPAHEALLRALVPDVLAALARVIDEDEARGALALEVLDELLEAAPGAVTPHLQPLLSLCLRVGGDESRGDAVRVRALNSVTFLAQKRPKALLRGGLLAPVLGGLLAPLCAPPPPGHPDPEDEDEEGEGRGGPSPRHAAAQALDALATGLPPHKLLQHLVPLLGGALGSPRAGRRKGGLLALGALAGGGGDALRHRFLAPTLEALRGGLGDPRGCVRGAAACALRSLAPSLQPEVQAVAAGALPGVLEALGGSRGGGPGHPSPAKEWYILESLLETLGEGVGPWLPQVLAVILGALEPSGPPRNVELGLSALHSLAASAGELLRPHGGEILGALTPLLQPGPPEHRPRRFQALGVLGALGRPVAGEGLVPALELGLRLVEEDEGEEPEGRRVVFALAGAVAEALGEGVAPLLPRVVPVLLGALQRPPPEAPPEGPDSFLLLEEEEEPGEEQPMDEQEDEEWEELVEVEVGGAYVEELRDACEALGELAQHSRAAFRPFLRPALGAVLPLLQLPGAGLRGSAYESLGSLCLTGWAGSAEATPPRREEEEEELGRALRALVGGARAEPRAEGAGPALGAIGRLLEGAGPALPRPLLLDPIGRLLADVIKGQVACLANEDEGGVAEAEAELREAAGEGLALVGAAVGGAFAPLFQEVLPFLLDAMGGDLPSRSWASAMLGEMGAGLGEGSAPFLPRLGPALAAAAQDPHPEVRGNALHAIGRLAAAAGHTLPQAWPGVAAVTRALTSEGWGRVRDNACGALARHGHALPAETVVPLLLGALPLAEDMEEEPPVFRFLLGLAPPTLWPHAAELPRACGNAVGSGRLPPDLESGLVGLLRDVWGSCPTAFEEGLARLPHGEAQRLRQALGS